MTIIKIEDLVVQIKKETILNIENLNIDKGFCTGFVGRNGSGKSVLFKAICGFIKYTGTISVNGKIIGKDCDFIENAGVVIEQPDFIGYLTPFENLLALAQINNKTSADEVAATIRLVGLDPNSTKKASKLSLGMKQRLRIAQALMENNDILILDEPFNGLDEAGVAEIRKLLLDLKKEKTILITSHIQEDINMLCDRVYHIAQGKIIDDDNN